MTRDNSGQMNGGDLQISAALSRKNREQGPRCAQRLGAGSRNRTGTPVRERDFESRASTYFAIPALGEGHALWQLPYITANRVGANQPANMPRHDRKRFNTNQSDAHTGRL